MTYPTQTTTAATETQEVFVPRYARQTKRRDKPVDHICGKKGPGGIMDENTVCFSNCG